MNQNNRAEYRLSIHYECILVNPYGLIETQSIDMSIIGLGVETDRTLPYIKNGCVLAAFVERLGFYEVKLIWTKKDFKNTTRLGLKFLPA